MKTKEQIEGELRDIKEEKLILLSELSEATMTTRQYTDKISEIKVLDGEIKALKWVLNIKS